MKVGETAKPKHIIAGGRTDEHTVFWGGDVRVLLSDMPLSPAARASDYQLSREVEDLAIHVATVGLRASGDVVGFFVQMRGDPQALLKPPGSPMGVGFRPLRFDKERVGGRVFADRPAIDATMAYRLDVTFAAVITPPPSPAEVASQLASPPVRAAEAYLAAIRAGDLEQFLALLADPSTGSARLIEHWRTSEEAWPADSRPVNIVTLSDGSVMVEFEGHASSRVTIGFALKLVLVQGAWKVIISW